MYQLHGKYSVLSNFASSLCQESCLKFYTTLDEPWISRNLLYIGEVDIFFIWLLLIVLAYVPSELGKSLLFVCWTHIQWSFKSLTIMKMQNVTSKFKRKKKTLIKQSGRGRCSKRSSIHWLTLKVIIHFVWCCMCYLLVLMGKIKHSCHA